MIASICRKSRCRQRLCRRNSTFHAELSQQEKKCRQALQSVKKADAGRGAAAPQAGRGGAAPAKSPLPFGEGAGGGALRSAFSLEKDFIDKLKCCQALFSWVEYRGASRRNWQFVDLLHNKFQNIEGIRSVNRPEQLPCNTEDLRKKLAMHNTVRWQVPPFYFYSKAFLYAYLIESIQPDIFSGYPAVFSIGSKTTCESVG